MGTQVALQEIVLGQLETGMRKARSLISFSDMQRAYISWLEWQCSSQHRGAARNHAHHRHQNVHINIILSMTTLNQKLISIDPPGFSSLTVIMS